MPVGVFDLSGTSTQADIGLVGPYPCRAGAPVTVDADNRRQRRRLLAGAAEPLAIRDICADVRDDAFMGDVSSGKFWFCIEHHRVENSEQTHGSNHLGPYPTEEAAAHALETAAERERAYDAEDAAWNGDS